MRREGVRNHWLGALAAVSATICWAGTLSAADYESAGKVKASDYLAADAMAGPEWKVAEEAENDGTMNRYVVESRFGDFEALGRASVGLRGKEVEALAELERVSKTEVFTDAVKQSALGSVETVVEFSKHPVETVKAVPGAIGGWFKKTKFQVEESYVDAKEAKEERDEKKDEKEALEASGDAEAIAADKEEHKGETKEKTTEAATAYALKYLKISGAELRWYAKLGVDPYTDNEPLRAAVKSYSRIEGLTSFGMKFAGIPKIPGARELKKTMDIVWTTDPWELRKINRDKLIAAGISEEVAREFEDNANLSLTMQTVFLTALETLKGVEGRNHLLARALDVESQDQGQALVQSTALLVRHHQGSRPLVEILEGAQTPVARSADGRLVVVMGADAIFWTEKVAQGAKGFFAIYQDDEAKTREIWVVGEASERVKSECKALGWDLFDEWQIAAPEDAKAAEG
jgi:hypothetical protein